ncbi:MAG: TenA family protein [Cardiobacteriaceae bacterium]|nr:TenA family protein [Cardiobacteriaceae bacterium]
MTYATLVRHCPQYPAYTHHEFVRRLGDGTLPQAAFRQYLQQDYLFLLHFTRAWALALYKSHSLEDMRAAQAGINAMLDTEIALHIDYCTRWGIAADSLHTLPEHPATVAYTRYVLDCGHRGTLADLHIALVPCIIGYADIGRHLAENPAIPLADNPYREWIEMYASAEYQAAAQAEAEFLRRLCPEPDARQQQIFNTATDMEIAFWQMGLDAADQAATPSTEKS